MSTSLSGGSKKIFYERENFLAHAYALAHETGPSGAPFSIVNKFRNY